MSRYRVLQDVIDNLNKASELLSGPCESDAPEGESRDIDLIIQENALLRRSIAIEQHESSTNRERAEAMERTVEMKESFFKRHMDKNVMRSIHKAKVADLVSENRRILDYYHDAQDRWSEELETLRQELEGTKEQLAQATMPTNQE